MKRILFSQNESAIKDDYFVIDGVVELDNVSNLSLKAFQIINDVENWKVIYKDTELEIRKKGEFLSIKSHYINKDESDRFIFYIYYVETNDISLMINLLKEDSLKINKELAFETEKLIDKLNKNAGLKKILIGIIAAIVISFIVWEIVK
ncbi:MULTISPECIES: hypothetical protein [Flavobacterium]|uniref:Uncharacterized protein n=2 Tax=Flavobacterium TaxID=237 RepID=A0A4R5CRW7_9FLAO|nr:MULTISPECIES: hypothetical protein [Flavobacterium]MDI5950100.1 hypothetical protein [Flavobacterium yafengii]TDE03309.1 hypothetical protein E0F91_11000 [Flavobacterium sandaracinum]